MDSNLNPATDPALVRRIVEAAILASSQPLSLAELQTLFPVDQPLPKDAIEAALEALREACADRGIELIEVASGFRYQVRSEVHPWVARLWVERAQRYTRASLETLALIAYRQPITRGEIEQIRGVAVSSNIIRTLEEREWIRVIGHRDVPGKPALFGTTKLFLDYFNLKSLDALPPLSELRDLAELDPQLQFDTDINELGAAELPPISMDEAADVIISPDIPATAALGSDDTLDSLTPQDPTHHPETEGATNDPNAAPEHIA